MEIATGSLIVSGFALLVSIWTRIESICLVRRQMHQLIVAKSGEAFVTAQQLKNHLSDCIEQLRNSLKTENIEPHNIIAHSARIDELERIYQDTWNFIKSMEVIIGAFESGEKVTIDPSRIEAKIAHFKQWKELAEYDSKYLMQAMPPQSYETK